MIRRPLIVQCRLTQEEHATFAPLIRDRHLWNWSELIRAALRLYHVRHVKEASDNAVIQAATETKTRPARPTAKKQPTRRGPSRRGNSKV